MSSTVSQRDYSFVQVNYEGLLDTILQVLKTERGIFIPLERRGVTSLLMGRRAVAVSLFRPHGYSPCTVANGGPKGLVYLRFSFIILKRIDTPCFDTNSALPP